jgi:membrane protease YdiL (CAAX protease family)
VTRAASATRLGLALACTALPVVLTTVILRALRLPAFASAHACMRSPYRDFVAYAAANWVTFAVVLGVVGREDLRRLGLRWRPTSIRVAVAIAGFVAGVVVYGAVSALLPRFGLPTVANMDIGTPTFGEAVIMLLSAVITAAFCEEVFFRVLWIGALRDRVPVWMAVILSLTAFAAIHYPYFGIGGVVFISIWALIPIGLFLAYEDVTAPVLMHVMNNTFAYVVVPLVFSVPK